MKRRVVLTFEILDIGQSSDELYDEAERVVSNLEAPSTWTYEGTDVQLSGRGEGPEA